MPWHLQKHRDTYRVPMVTHTKTHRNTHTRRRAPTEFMTPWHTLHWGLQRAPSFCHCSDSELLSVWMCWMCLLSYIRCQIRAKQSDVAAIPSMFHKSWSKPRWALCICCKANKGNVKDFMVHHVWHMSMFTESKCIWSDTISSLGTRVCDLMSDIKCTTSLYQECDLFNWAE